MTNEEAKAILKRLYSYLNEEGKRALDVAFEALEKQPPNDLVGKECYKIRMLRSNRFYGKYPYERKIHCYTINTRAEFERYRKYEPIHHWEIVKSTISKTTLCNVGKTIFLTRKEAEVFLRANGIDWSE